MQKEKNLKETYNKQNNLSPQSSISTNPISSGSSGIVAKINILGSGMNSTTSSHTFLNHHNEKSYGVIDYTGYIKEINDIISQNFQLKDFLNSFHNLFINRLNCGYTAIGFINDQSTYINIRLLDKNSNVFSFKIFNNDRENEINKALEISSAAVPLPEDIPPRGWGKKGNINI